MTDCENKKMADEEEHERVTWSHADAEKNTMHWMESRRMYMVHLLHYCQLIKEFEEKFPEYELPTWIHYMPNGYKILLPKDGK